MLKVTNLLYSVEDKVLFEICNLKIPKGKYSLIGNNGIGKSILLDLITNQTKIKAGQIEVEKNHIYINQSPQLLSNISAKDNIVYLNPSQAKAVISEVANRGINIKSKVRNLSGGQQRLFYLLICLHSDYHLYLIDEPFNNLAKKHIEYFKSIIEKRRIRWEH